MKQLLLTLAILAFVFPGAVTANAEQTAPQKQVSTANQSQKSAVKKTVAKKRHKKRKYVASPKENLKVESIPLVSRIPDEAIQALAKNDLEETIRVLRPESPSSRLLYILSAAQDIVKYKAEKKAPRLDRHQFYQNLGISYHNLFLFLKGHQITNEVFYKEALKFYTKAGRSLAISEKHESYILKAAIMASYGEIAKAQKLFAKADTHMFSDDYNRMEYLATYYAAIGDVESSVEALREAYALNPEGISIWVVIGDDFNTIANEPKFKSLIASWKK